MSGASEPMLPTMMAFPMTVQMILRRGARYHADSRVADFDGSAFHQTGYAEVAERAARLAAALRSFGVRPNDRVATFCWNHRAHLEAYLAVPAMGAVLHTLNIRLFAEQIAYIARHAGDRVLIADAGLLPQIAPILPGLSAIELLIVTGGKPPALPGFAGQLLCYDDVIAGHAPLVDWPDLDEASAAVACYTTGTTGDPKGVVYSHKTIFVHSLASLGTDSFAIARADRILMLPPMFHANAWGLPYSGWMAGSVLVMPGPHLQPAKVRTMIEAARPTFTAAVPTILTALLDAHRERPIDMASFRIIVSGGAAVAPALIDRVREAWHVPVVQGWGMTETSPLCVLSHPPLDTPAGEQTQWRAKSGKPVAGVEVRIVDGDGRPLPEDGETVGALELRGPWIARGYFGRPEGEALSADGWLRTGDVGTIDALGYVAITDRVKDIIKSGGEWISSVDLENQLSRHPDIHEAAVIGVADPRWDERPLAIVAAAHGATVEPAALRRFLLDRVARFQLPEYWAFVAELPKTSVGKVDKRALRAAVAEGKICYVREDRVL